MFDRRLRRYLCVLAVAAQCLVTAGAIWIGFSVDVVPQPREVTATIRPYVVQPGDSLWRIAERFHPDKDRREVIAEISRISALQDTRIVSYQRIFIPDFVDVNS